MHPSLSYIGKITKFIEYCKAQVLILLLIKQKPWNNRNSFCSLKVLYDLENCNFQTDTLISIFIFDFLGGGPRDRNCCPYRPGGPHPSKRKCGSSPSCLSGNVKGYCMHFKLSFYFYFKCLMNHCTNIFFFSLTTNFEFLLRLGSRV